MIMAQWLNSAEALCLHYMLCDVLERQATDPHGAGNSSEFISDSVCVIYGEGKNSRAKADVFTLLEKDLGIRYSYLHNDIRAGACVSMARDQACKWKPGFYQFLSNFLVTRRGGSMHPPIPFQLPRAGTAQHEVPRGTSRLGADLRGS